MHRRRQPFSLASQDAATERLEKFRKLHNDFSCSSSLLSEIVHDNLASLNSLRLSLRQDKNAKGKDCSKNLAAVSNVDAARLDLEKAIFSPLEAEAIIPGNLSTIQEADGPISFPSICDRPHVATDQAVPSPSPNTASSSQLPQLRGSSPHGEACVPLLPLQSAGLTRCATAPSVARRNESSLAEYEARQLEGVLRAAILEAVGSSLDSEGVGVAQLFRAGLPWASISRLYRIVYLYANGVHTALTAALRPAKKAQQPVLLVRVWSILVQLSEHLLKASLPSPLTKAFVAGTKTINELRAQCEANNDSQLTLQILLEHIRLLEGSGSQMRGEYEAQLAAQQERINVLEVVLKEQVEEMVRVRQMENMYLRTLQVQLEDVQRSHAHLEGQLAAAIADRDSFQQELEDKNRRSLARSPSRGDADNGRVESLLSAVKTAQEDLALLRQSRDKLSEENAVLSRLLAEATPGSPSRSPMARMGVVEAELAKAKKAAEEATGAIAALRDEVASLQAKVDAEAQRRRQAEDKYEEVRGREAEMLRQAVVWREHAQEMQHLLDGHAFGVRAGARADAAVQVGVGVREAGQQWSPRGRWRSDVGVVTDSRDDLRVLRSQLLEEQSMREQLQHTLDATIDELQLAKRNSQLVQSQHVPEVKSVRVTLQVDPPPPPPQDPQKRPQVDRDPSTDVLDSQHHALRIQVNQLDAANRELRRQIDDMSRSHAAAAEQAAQTHQRLAEDLAHEMQRSQQLQVSLSQQSAHAQQGRQPHVVQPAAATLQQGDHENHPVLRQLRDEKAQLSASVEKMQGQVSELEQERYRLKDLELTLLQDLETCQQELADSKRRKVAAEESAYQWEQRALSAEEALGFIREQELGPSQHHLPQQQLTNLLPIIPAAVRAHIAPRDVLATTPQPSPHPSPHS